MYNLSRVCDSYNIIQVCTLISRQILASAHSINQSNKLHTLCTIHTYMYIPTTISPPDPGACFICNDCPDDDEEEDSTANNSTCSSRPRGEGSSSCVETTAYALKALLAVEDTQTAVCLAQWLIQIKSGSGGFYSSQVCIMYLYNVTCTKN